MAGAKFFHINQGYKLISWRFCPKFAQFGCKIKSSQTVTFICHNFGFVKSVWDFGAFITGIWYLYSPMPDLL